MTMQAPAAAQVVLPFQFGARLKRMKLSDSSGSLKPSFALDGGTREFQLDTIGYGYGLLVHISGIWTIANAGLVFKGAGIWDYLRRAVLDTPGQAAPVDVSGDGLHNQGVLARDFSIHQHTIGPRATSSGLDVNPWAAANLDSQLDNSVGARQLHLFYFVPLARNAHDLRGVRSLGHAGQRTTLRLTPSTTADLVLVGANSDSSAITVDVTEYFFDGAPAGVGVPPPGWAIVIEETEQLVQAVGKQAVAIDPEGIILNALSKVILNDAPDSADVEEISLNLDARKLVDEEPFADYAYFYEQATGIRLPVGVVPFDREVYADDMEPIDPIAGGYRGRDWIFSDELVKFFPTIKIAAAANLGAVAKISTSIRRLIKL